VGGAVGAGVAVGGGSVAGSIVGLASSDGDGSIDSDGVGQGSAAISEPSGDGSSNDGVTPLVGSGVG
jgi:hypothetical protein